VRQHPSIRVRKSRGAAEAARIDWREKLRVSECQALT
jgi:hypothetical protein